MGEDKIYLFCYGENCVLKELCQRFLLGQRIDSHAPGYSWIHNCDVEVRNAYIPTKNS